MELMRINATLDKKIVQWIDHYAQDLHEDRSTAIRQLLAQAILEKQKKQILQAFASKKLTLRKAAQMLGVDYWTMQEFLEEARIPMTDLTDAEINKKKNQVDQWLLK